VGTYNGFAITLYMNGANVGTTSASGNVLAGVSEIGALSALNNFNGLISNVQVYNIALTSNQVLQLYQEGAGGIPINANSVIAFPINASSSNTLSRIVLGPSMPGSSMSDYASVLQKEALSHNVNVILANQSVTVFQTSPLWLNLTYVALAVINSTFGTVLYPLRASAAVPVPVAYVNVTLDNAQSASAPAQFQQMLTVNAVAYKAYERGDLGNIRFYQNNAALYSWCEYACANTSTNSIFWVKLPDGLPASSNTVITIAFMPKYAGYGAGIGAIAGEAPQLSGTYAQYDNGASVFSYYNVNPSSTFGWSLNGAGVGITSSAPAGSYFGTTNAYYAQDGSSSYMYDSTAMKQTNSIITYWNYVTSGGGCSDFFFVSSAAGAGQFARIDGRGGYPTDTGILPTTGWASWSGSGNIADPSTNTWDKVDLVISAQSSATMYVNSVTATPIGVLGSANSGAIGISNNGAYIGFQSDNCGTSTDYYWNGFIERVYPPNGVMPTTSFGSVVNLA
jgi:hypothetical protein